ncbi:MAG: hypothetical protein ACLPV8_12880 [Steroidobacteraceae bacterium]
MIYFLALIPATALTIAGYFVLYLSHRSDGAFRALGKYLGFWAFTLAALVVLAAIFAAAHGGHHGGMMSGRMHHRWPGNPRFPGPDVDDLRGNALPPAPPDANPKAPPTPPAPR